MRLRELHLTRYGRFTDRVIDFGHPRAGLPDLHIVYGANEAGKSTKLSAWLDLLFGIPHQSRYDFMHKGTMRVGALLEVEGRDLRLTRVKTRSASLLDAHDAAVPEATLEAHLGGLDRARYQAMFSLDDGTLRDGGDSILAAQGDLGQMLFSSSAGLSGLSAALTGLRDHPDTFHRASGTGARSNPLSDLKRRIEATDAERKALDTTAQDHRRLTEARDRAHAAWEDAGTAHRTLAAEAAALDQIATALPSLHRLDHAQTTLSAMPALPPVPPDWPDRAARLERDRATTAALVEAAGHQWARAEARIAEMVQDPAILAQDDRFAAAEALRSAHDEAVKDLPAREADLRQKDLEIEAQLARLGMAGRPVAAVLVPVATMAGLRRLHAARSGLGERLARAAAEADAAQRARVAAEVRLHATGSPGVPVDRLAALLARLRSRDPDAALRQARQGSAQAAAALARQMAGLAPWRGTPEALGALQPPARSWLDRLGAEAEAAQAALRDAEAAAQALRRDAGDDGPAPSVNPDDDAFDLARAERERMWAIHRGALTDRTAEAFETAMRRDDRLSDLRARAEADRALRAQARAARALHASRQAMADEAVNHARAARDAVAGSLRGTIAALSPDLPPDLTLPDLRDFLARREAAQEAALAHAEAVAAETAALADLNAAAATLRQALAGNGEPAPDASYDRLIVDAEALVEAGQRAAQLIAAAATARDEDTRRAVDLTQAREADESWRADWSALCGPTCLADHAGDDPQVTGKLLALLDQLRKLADERHVIADRIAKMALARAAFRAELDGLAAALGLAADDPAAGWAALGHRLARARTTRDRLAEATADLSAARIRRDDLTAAEAAQVAEMGRMAATLGLDDIAALHRCLARSAERDRLAQACRQHADDILRHLPGVPLDAARARLQDRDPAMVDADRAQAKARQDHASTALQQAYATLSAAEAALRAIGDGDDAARLEERRQTLLMEVEDGALRHLRRRFGIIAMDHALRIYRDTHSSAMMTHASDAFRTISRGAYAGLSSLPERDREQLIATARDGSSKLPGDLSKGTCMQLYLALRVAGYHVLAETRRPVPFIADDIMESFDDDRSAEAFQLLGRMAGVGQVIYLTHHRHLCAIASQVCPDAVIHDIAGMSA